MQDLSGYGLVAQSFEFLVHMDPTSGDIAPGLAESWTPNADNSVWTFKLRQGVKWQNGADLKTDDVIATMARLVKAGNSGLKGIIDDKSTVAKDASTLDFTLISPNGNFPYLVSVFNAQTAITPATYETGTTLDAKPDGTGPWILENYDQATGATFSRNAGWWGGTTPLDSVEFTFFDEVGPMVTAYQGGQIDAIVQFDVFSGANLFTDPNFTVSDLQTTNHRQIWMRTDKGQFKDKRVRQALALTLDREQMLKQLFQGKAQLANDHVIWQGYKYFNSSVPQRVRDVAKAKTAPERCRRFEPFGPASRSRAAGDPGSRRAHPELGEGSRDQPGDREGGARHLLWRPVVPGRTGRSAMLGRGGARDRRLRASPDAGRLPQLSVQDERRLELVAVGEQGLRCRVQRVPASRRRRGPDRRVRQDRDDHER